MRTIETKVYKFDELSNEAKEVARNWYREYAFDYEWWDFTYEDAERIGLKITSFDIDRHKIEGHLTEDVLEVIRRIRVEHGKKCGTYKLTVPLYRRKSLTEDEVEEFTHALLEEYLVMLRNEAEYIVSEEAVDESIRANDYEFTEDGRRA